MRGCLELCYLSVAPCRLFYNQILFLFSQIHPAAQCIQDCVQSFADGWLADSEFPGGFTFRADLPEHDGYEPATRFGKGREGFG